MKTDKLIAGDTLDFETVIADYPASEGYSLFYRMVPRSAVGPEITIGAIATGDTYRVQAAPATTAGWVAGFYSWSAWVEKAGFRTVVDSGTVRILDDPGVVAFTDNRTQAARAVEDLRTALATYTSTSGHIAEYTINNRSMKFRNAGEILQLLKFWENELARENAALAVNSGQANPRRIYLRSRRV